MQIKILNSTPMSASNERPQPNSVGLHATRNYIPLIARILLAALFIVSGINKVLNPASTLEYMATYGMPLTQLFLVAAIAIELVGGLSLVFGYKARLGAIALAVFTVVATLIFHTDLSDQIQQIMFLKNLSILGGLLMVIQYGPGNITVR